MIKTNDLILLLDSQFQKFNIHWQGPYRVVNAYKNSSCDLEDFRGNPLTTCINGNRLKIYCNN